MLRHIKCPRCLRVSWMGRWYRELRYPPETNMTGWNIHHLKMYFLLKMGIFPCHVSFQFMVGAIFVGTFKGISKDSADFFSQAWFKKDPPCQPWWFWTYLKRAKRNGVWISCYFPTHTFLGGTLPKSSMRKTLGAKHELRIHQFQWCVCAKKTRHRWLKCSINTARYRVNSYTIYYIYKYLLYIYIYSCTILCCTDYYHDYYHYSSWETLLWTSMILNAMFFF